jgi:hypothetical protein
LAVTLHSIHRLFLSCEDRLVTFFGRRFWKDADLVTFPLATYDRVDILIDRTLPSILGQSHRDIEVIVVLDGTPLDQCVRLREITDSRVKVFRLSRRTSYPKSSIERWMVAGWRPRNVAARKGKGRWVYWISDDDILMPNAVKSLLELARRDSAEVVSGAYRSGTLSPVLHRPHEGSENFGIPISGPPVWLCRSYLGLLRWNRFSWRKSWNRPSDYDLIERMVDLNSVFAATDEVLALQPDVEGSSFAGLRGAIDVSQND